MIKAVFFDFFNTLVGYETSREQVYMEVCAKYGIKVDQRALVRAYPIADKYLRDQFRIRPSNKRSKLNMFNLYLNHASVLLNNAGVKINKMTAFQIVLNWLRYNWDFVPFQDGLDILKYCKENNYLVGVISNIDKDMADLFLKLGMKQYIDFYVTSHEAGCDKPAPGIFNLALKKANIKPEEIIYIGDQYETDMLGAKGVGIKGVLIDRNNWFSDIVDCPRINDLLELKTYLI
jgi:putative hydrolase of the HAD superfamily